MRVLVFMMCGAPFDFGKCIERGQFFRQEMVFSLTLFTLFADLDVVKMASN